MSRALAALAITAWLLAAPMANADPTEVVAAARTAVGVPYRWGGTDLRGMDCSGLVVWAHAQAGISVPRTSQQQAVAGMPVARADLEPGDVIVFYPDASHVGLYAGEGHVIHASTYGRPVAEVPIDAVGPYRNARRLV